MKDILQQCTPQQLAQISRSLSNLEEVSVVSKERHKLAQMQAKLRADMVEEEEIRRRERQEADSADPRVRGTLFVCLPDALLIVEIVRGFPSLWFVLFFCVCFRSVAHPCTHSVTHTHSMSSDNTKKHQARLTQVSDKIGKWLNKIDTQLNTVEECVAEKLRQAATQSSTEQTQAVAEERTETQAQTQTQSVDAGQTERSLSPKELRAVVSKILRDTTTEPYAQRIAILLDSHSGTQRKDVVQDICKVLNDEKAKRQ